MPEERCDFGFRHILSAAKTARANAATGYAAQLADGTKSGATLKAE